MSFTVAIDGPAAAGKGTISKAVAKHFGFAHLDTGLLYRAVAKKILDQSLSEDIEKNAPKIAKDLKDSDLQSDCLRTPEVAQMASKVATIYDVRTALVLFQRKFAQHDPGAVLDGRDIGTVICPNAEVKLFITASAEVRAKRRFLELTAKGEDITFEAVLENLKIRDERDASRDVAPMVAAFDAQLIDTSDMTIDAAILTAVQNVDSILSNR